MGYKSKKSSLNENVKESIVKFSSLEFLPKIWSKMVESVIAMYKVMYESIIPAVNAGNVPEITQHNPNIHCLESINLIKFLLSKMLGMNSVSHAPVLTVGFNSLSVLKM